jgi:S-adenosylmethionine:tRNA ribosyltransferase-isomerase
VLLSDFDYELPEELIAQAPLADRAASRMLVVDRRSGTWEDRVFGDFPGYLHSGDCLVLNDSRVFPSRLYGRREHGEGGRVEVFLTRQVSADGLTWEALVRPGRKMRTGERIVISEPRPSGSGARGVSEPRPSGRGARVSEPRPSGSGARKPIQQVVTSRVPEGVSGGVSDHALIVEILGRGAFGERTVRLRVNEDRPKEDLYAILDRVGHVPLPPYIRRADTREDRDRYQTVFARERGSIAAPTAGLHFTPEILEACRNAGTNVARVTLHVGLGTFQPLRDEVIERAHLHSESFTVPAETVRAMDAASRVVAVGTTSVRAIESSAAINQTEVIDNQRRETDLFIYPGFEFRRTGAMLTNFHLPKSSLLVLVCAFAGRELTLAAYRHAVARRYRFFSYGDCMLIV